MLGEIVTCPVRNVFDAFRSSWLIRSVRLWTCSDVPEIGSVTVGVFGAFDVTCSVDVNVPAVVGAKSDHGQGRGSAGRYTVSLGLAVWYRSQ